MYGSKQFEQDLQAFKRKDLKQLKALYKLYKGLHLTKFPEAHKRREFVKKRIKQLCQK